MSERIASVSVGVRETIMGLCLKSQHMSRLSRCRDKLHTAVVTQATSPCCEKTQKEHRQQDREKNKKQAADIFTSHFKSPPTYKMGFFFMDLRKTAFQHESEATQISKRTTSQVIKN